MVMLNHSIIVEDRLIAADGVQTFDLGVNPLSVLLLRLRPLNDTGNLEDKLTFMLAAAAINLCTIRHRGQSIIALRGDELGALAVMRHGWSPWEANPTNVNNERVEFVVPIFMGRRPYDPNSCFPATRRGEFSVELDFDIASTGYDGMRLAIESIEIFGAKPKEFERKVQLSQTFAATGINDIDMPLGNLLRGIMLFGTTAAGGATPVPTLGRLSLIADTVGVAYSSTDIETLYALNAMRNGPPMGDHLHNENLNATYLADQNTGRANQPAQGYENHAYMDLDPNGNDMYSIDSSRVSRLQLRVTAESADAVRVVPIERFPTSKLE